MGKQTVVFFLLIVVQLFATGASSIRSEICPIAVDSFGSVLCKYRFSKNESGGHRPMPTEYGFCILESYSIIQYPTQTINISQDEDENHQYKLMSQCDSIYYDTTINYDSLKNILGYSNSFEAETIAEYRVDTTLSLAEFEKYFHINPENHPQNTLENNVHGKYVSI